MSVKIDISQLAVQRNEPSKPKIKMTKGKWISRYALPMAILFSFTGLLAWGARDSVLPSSPVSIVPVVISEAEITQTGAPLFQAAGWVEPRPASIVVSALAPGIVKDILVVEGQLVTKGENLAYLLETDALIKLNVALADLKLQEAELQAAKADLVAAQLSLEKPLKLQADLADALAAVAELDVELDQIPVNLNAVTKQHEIALENLENKKSAGNSIAGRTIREAEAELANWSGNVKILSARKPILERQRKALLRKTSVLKEQLELKLNEHRNFAQAEASLKAAEARLERSKLIVKTARLELSRMTIVSPLNGRVLSVQALTGMRVMGLDPHSEKGSSAIVTLYDPDKVQVRVDVRLEDVARVKESQLVNIETASIPGSMTGKVVGITSRADIQKNTLQIKVAINNPSELIRPEMLAQVTFLAPEQEQSTEEKERLRLLVPRQLVINGENNAQIWVADQQTKTAQLRTITLGKAGTNELVEVSSGLTPTDKLISGGQERLETGERIRITSEDRSLGIKQVVQISEKIPTL